jgi:hypothetical protein
MHEIMVETHIDNYEHLMSPLSLKTNQVPHHTSDWDARFDTRTHLLLLASSLLDRGRAQNLCLFSSSGIILLKNMGA